MPSTSLPDPSANARACKSLCNSERELPALAAKLDLALDERSGEFFGDSEDMKAIKSDARRLASPGKE